MLKKNLKDYTPEEMCEYCNDYSNSFIKNFTVLQNNLRNLKTAERIAMFLHGLHVYDASAFALTRKNILVGRKKLFGTHFTSIPADTILSAISKKN